MSLFTNFSVKNENSTLEDNNPNISKIFDNELSLSEIGINDNDINNNYIVYNIESEFLIPIKIIKQENENKSEVTIKFVDNKIRSLYGDKITINKNDIYYELIDNFELIEDFSNSKNINDLNILYHIQLNILNGNSFFYIGNILNIINQNTNKENSRILINNMFKISSKDEICFIYQKYGSNNNNNIDFENFLVDAFLTYNESRINYQHNHYIIQKCFQLTTFIKDIRILFSITTKLNIIPVLPTKIKTNDLYLKSIFFNNSSETFVNNFMNSNYISQKNEIQSFLTNISIELDYYEGNELFINILYSIFVKDLNKQNVFTNCMIIFINAYKENLNKNYFYSNICILVIFEYAFDELEIDKNIKNHLLILCNSSNKEDDSLLNEIIKKQTIVYNKKAISQNFPLINYLSYYLEGNINYYESIIENDKKLKEKIKKLEFFSDLSFLEKKINEAKYSNVIEFFRKITLLNIDNLFNKIYKNSIQIFDLFHLSSLDEFKSFIQNIDSIPEFFSLTHLVEYAKMYHDFSFHEKLLLRRFNMNNEIYFIDYIKKVIKIQSLIRSKNVHELISDLRNKTKKIQNNYRKFKFRQYKNISIDEILELGLKKYKNKDKLIYNLCYNYKNKIINLKNNNENFKNDFKENECNNLNFSETISDDLEDEKRNLLNEYNSEIENFSELITSSENFIKKMTKLFETINKNSEIKEILLKNGIEFN